jgi:hypothetical protein|tara:strand:- start:1176 stop:1373 length:198 start_codon:yes stop_codon:yes gene_type:complete
MNLLEIHRSSKMVIVEVLTKDFEEEDFDEMWDEIRYVYEERFYSLKKIEKKSNKILIKLNIIKRK